MKEKPGSVHGPRSCPCCMPSQFPRLFQSFTSASPQARSSTGASLQHFLFFEPFGPTKWQHILLPDREGITVANDPCVCRVWCVVCGVCVSLSISLHSWNEPWTVKLCGKRRLFGDPDMKKSTKWEIFSHLWQSLRILFRCWGFHTLLGGYLGGSKL